MSELNHLVQSSRKPQTHRAVIGTEIGALQHMYHLADFFW